MANGSGTNTLKLAGFIESITVVIYSSFHNSILRFDEDIRAFLTVS